MIPIRLIPRKAHHPKNELEAVVGAQRFFVADFPVPGAEAWKRVPGGLLDPRGRILNVDHHADLPSMARAVSSANLALAYLEAAASTSSEPFEAVVINHLDCDSVLSAGLLSRRLSPDPRYGRAAIAADHTGQEHPIADLLQGLDAHWSRTGRSVNDDALEFFFEALARSEAGAPLQPLAQEALEYRADARRRAKEMVREGHFHVEGGVAMAELDDPVEGELFLPILPDALIVGVSAPHREHPERRQVKVRLSPKAPAGLTLHALGVQQFDENFGGRWNAGSNNRGGGTEMSTDDYRTGLVQLLAAWRDAEG